MSKKIDIGDKTIVQLGHWWLVAMVAILMMGGVVGLVLLRLLPTTQPSGAVAVPQAAPTPAPSHTWMPAAEPTPTPVRSPTPTTPLPAIPRLFVSDKAGYFSLTVPTYPHRWFVGVEENGLVISTVKEMAERKGISSQEFERREWTTVFVNGGAGREPSLNDLLEAAKRNAQGRLVAEPPHFDRFKGLDVVRSRLYISDAPPAGPGPVPAPPGGLAPTAIPRPIGGETLTERHVLVEMIAGKGPEGVRVGTYVVGFMVHPWTAWDKYQEELGLILDSLEFKAAP